jgi:hypothetical protein
VQSAGCTSNEAHQLVDYVFSRPKGELEQEVGGTLTTLAGLCSAHGVDMLECGETELSRVWKKVEQIRKKQRNKPKVGPLPVAPHTSMDYQRAVKLVVRHRKGEAEMNGDASYEPPLPADWIVLSVISAYQLGWGERGMKEATAEPVSAE